MRSNRFTIFSDEAAPFAITRVESPAEWIKVSFRKAADNERIVRGRPEQPQFRVNVTIDGQKAKVSLQVVRTKTKRELCRKM